MLTTDKQSCNILADLLVAHGVRHVVLSPGSRNAPLVLALSRREDLQTDVVIDERSAAFIALGMSIQSGEPVAIVCTSGSALLNYAPAVAEAFYRCAPLIVISADRPEEWIDQDDSQTIWQQNALAPYVKRSCDIPAHTDFPNGKWVCNRLINDLLLEAVNGRRGPVHINIRLDAPLNKLADYTENASRVIRMVSPSVELPTAEARKIGESIASPRKVLIIVGFHEPDEKLNRALAKLAKLPNVAVMTETIANLHSPLFINRIDSTLCRLSNSERQELAPDVVITAGGALVSRFVKDWLRQLDNVEHWHVGLSHTTIDCFKHLSLRVEMRPAIFLRQLASALQIFKNPSDYAARWRDLAAKADILHQSYLKKAPWSDMKAFGYLIPNIPARWNLQLSNGTPIRYAQLMDCNHLHRCDCNRGVSGIDGCSSTALGASTMYSGTTLLITGDMSCQYDLAALSSMLVTPKFKIIVICNEGGGIFRFIPSTSSLPELEKYFAVGTRLPLRQLADGYGFHYGEAHDFEELKRAFAEFVSVNDRPAILAVFTPPVESAEVLKQYFQQP
ncbi:2-succinyl-5-enolpyruvyl-6-hydroxy-3-cyclohexene-1-carboxylic-acid synthase [uncultured Duncaniella sp.]|uniref:2-succinyl-5-enolpyruvyl-6-hydroxy-3- cyclohexene-1-carboxylic-acid synthase n=1 Tax=uncultured Duncaniella sp. TaxID=2768039 RepID=UPI0026282E42|nr:2-succinyl-5-enolpyruvyl-6-hydroxy-3-cyclohexene-1-carboxylic-acid synthase [uncultured Duncaniella sp.]